MKVLCVNNEYVKLSITVDKWYQLFNGEMFLEPDFAQFKDNTYIIYDDNLRWVKLSQKYFKTREEIREAKIKDLGL
jgi:hypothetical protein